MDTYIFAFHGGAMPNDETERAAIMANWGAWMETLGQAIADPGSILAGSHTVHANGITQGAGSDPLSGYMIVSAKGMDAALTMAQGCPILTNNGNIEVAQLVTP